ncbi:MAG: 1-phosphofructokinase family hexose kinase [Halochromatium sp.]
MPDVVTLTMNPALDLSSETEQLTPGKKTRCSLPRHTPGGGGINVARGLHRLGTDVLAVYPSGGPTGQRLDGLLNQAGIRTQSLPIEGDIRENLSLAEQAPHLESPKVFHLVFPGPTLAEREWQTVPEALEAIAPAPRYLVLSGSLPPGVPADFYAEVAQRVSQRGTRVVLDTAAPTLDATLSAQPPLFLIKPNHHECHQLFKVEREEPEAYLTGMDALLAKGTAEAIVVTLGSQGAVVAAEGLRLHLQPPSVEGRAPMGAGDSFVSALIHRLTQDGRLSEAARDGVAAAAAAVKIRDANLYRKQDLEQLRSQVQIHEHHPGHSQS